MEGYDKSLFETTREKKKHSTTKNHSQKQRLRGISLCQFSSAIDIWNVFNANEFWFETRISNNNNTAGIRGSMGGVHSWYDCRLNSSRIFFRFWIVIVRRHHRKINCALGIKVACEMKVTWQTKLRELWNRAAVVFCFSCLPIWNGIVLGSNDVLCEEISASVVFASNAADEIAKCDSLLKIYTIYITVFTLRTHLFSSLALLLYLLLNLALIPSVFYASPPTASPWLCHEHKRCHSHNL